MIKEFVRILSWLLYFGFVAYVLHKWDWSCIVKLELKFCVGGRKSVSKCSRMTYIRLDEHHAVPNGQVFVLFATVIRVSLNPSYTRLKWLGHEGVHSPMGRTMRTSNLNKFYYIELSLHNIQITVAVYNWLNKRHVSALFGHYQAYRKMVLRYIRSLYRLTPSFCKPDDGRTRPKHDT